MPKEVDHPGRRRELADAACRVIARNGLSGTTLTQVAEESEWSIGSIRWYFPTKTQLIDAALWRVGERVDERIRRRTAGGMGIAELRIAALELLPLDANRREEALVHLAFLAQAAVTPELAESAEDTARRLQEPLAARFAAAIHDGELPAHLHPQHEARRLRALLDGLAIQLVTAPRHASAKWAKTTVDEHFSALVASPNDATSPSPRGNSAVRP